jgi:NADH dehydrogenase
MRILVLGGSGFIGRHAVRALLARGHAVLIGTRRPAARHPCPAREAHFEDLGEPRAWAPLLRDVDAVVNAVGILRERRRETYDRVHHRAPGALAGACAPRRIRLIHVSALGLHAAARSGFITSKLAGERAVAASGADHCIVRPSLLDGEAIARLCELPSLPRVAEMGGTAAYTMAGYLDGLRAARSMGQATVIPVPGWAARAASHAFDLLHFSPFSFGHWELMRRDNLPCPNALPALLGRAPAPVGALRTRPEARRSLRAAGGRAS